MDIFWKKIVNQVARTPRPIKVGPVLISAKGLVTAVVSSRYLTWFFRLSQIFNQIGKSRKLKKSQLSAPLKTENAIFQK